MASKTTTLNPYNYSLTVDFTENSTSVEDNSSNITLSATLQANGNWWSTENYPSTLTLYWHDNKDDTDVYVDSISFYGLNGAYDSKTVTKTINVTHKDDGTLSGYAYAYFEKGLTTSGFAPNSGGVETDLTALTSIARYFTQTPVISFNSNTPTSITINWSTSEICDLVKYYLDSGSGIEVFSGSDTSGSFTISNLDPNTSHTIYAKCRRKDSQLSSNSNTITAETSSKTINLKVNNEWKRAIPYLKVNGEWKVAIPYLKVNGEWKQVI